MFAHTSKQITINTVAMCPDFIILLCLMPGNFTNTATLLKISRLLKITSFLIVIWYNQYQITNHIVSLIVPNIQLLSTSDLLVAPNRLVSRAI